MIIATGLEVLRAVLLKIQVLRDVTHYSLSKRLELYAQRHSVTSQKNRIFQIIVQVSETCSSDILYINTDITHVTDEIGRLSS